MTPRKKLKSDIALIESEKITIHGLDLSRDLLGKTNLGDMGFLQLKGRLPTPQESTVFNAIAVTFVEHGIEPATLAARMVYAGAPEALQAAVGAGLCSMGSGMPGSMQQVAQILQQAIPDASSPADLDTLARKVVQDHSQSQNIPGIGHDLHTEVDPRTARLFEIARDNGFDGPYTALMRSIAQCAEKTFGRKSPLNAAGAMGAVASELGLPWQIVRGVAVMARAVGLVGHVLEEMRDPMATEIRIRVAEEATAHLRST